MANDYSGPGGSVKIHPPNLNRLINKIVKAVVTGSQKAGKQSLKDIKVIIQDGIKNNSLGLLPLKESTILSRKNPSLGQAPLTGRPRSFRKQPLMYSGETIKGIRVKVNGNSMSLGFDEGATISYNKQSMEYVASLQEHGFNIKGSYTKKQLAYLHILFRNGKNKSKAVLSSNATAKAKIGEPYVINVEPRPAWYNATAKAIPIVKINFDVALSEAIRKLGLS